MELQNTPSSQSVKMPDVSHEAQVEVVGSLEKVGMEEIAVPVNLLIEGKRITVSAKASAFVSLSKSNAKGIHMSRLYLSLKHCFETEVLTRDSVSELLETFVASQDGLSDNSFVKVAFDLPLKRKALLSQQTGWRQYPIEIEAKNIGGEIVFEISGKITYSSTCPCSAALARQLIQQKFAKDFAGQDSVSFNQIEAWLGMEQSIVATPHAQRSYATFSIRVNKEQQVPGLVELIDVLESALSTPVQTAVKRQDEQEFARLNGTNLMFCEDAARRVKQVFESDKRIIDYRVHIDHRESLHAHNAVSVAVKGVKDGYQA